MLETFADQAVIAIENVRLFKELDERTNELTRSVGELKALGEVGQAVSSTLDLETVLTRIASHAVQLTGAAEAQSMSTTKSHKIFILEAATRSRTSLSKLACESGWLGGGPLGKAASSRTPVEVTDILDERELPPYGFAPC